MAPKHDVWQYLAEQGAAGKVSFPTDAADDVATAITAALAALGYLKLAELDMGNGSFGNPGNNAGSEILARFQAQRNAAVTTLERHHKTLEHMIDAFIKAGKLYRGTDAHGKKEFKKIKDFVLSESDKNRYGAQDTFEDSSEKDEGNRYDEGGAVNSKETKKAGANPYQQWDQMDGSEYGEEMIAPWAPDPPGAASMSWAALANLGSSINAGPLRTAARGWMRQSARIQRIANTMGRDARTAMADWEGLGQRQAATFVQTYVGELKSLGLQMRAVGELLAFSAGWLEEAAPLMPRSSTPTTGDGNSDGSWGDIRTHDGALLAGSGDYVSALLSTIRANYDGWYRKPFTVVGHHVPKIPEHKAMAVPKGFTTDFPTSRNPNSKYPNGKVPGSNNNQQPQGTTTVPAAVKNGITKLTAAEKSVQTALTKLQKIANRMQAGINKITEGYRLMQAGQTDRGAALIRQGQKEIREARTDMTAALKDVDKKEKAVRDAAKALGLAAKGSPAAIQKYAKQAAGQAETFLKSAEKAEGQYKKYLKGAESAYTQGNNILLSASQQGSGALPNAPQTVGKAQPGLFGSIQGNQTAANQAGTPQQQFNPAQYAQQMAQQYGQTAGYDPTAAAQSQYPAATSGDQSASQLAGLAQQASGLGQQGLQDALRAGQQPSAAALQNAAAAMAHGGPTDKIPPHGGGGGGGAGAAPEPLRDYAAKLFPRSGVQVSAGMQASATSAIQGQPGSGQPAASQPGPAGPAGSPGAGHGAGGGAQERKRPKYLQSTEHLDQALGDAPDVFKPVIDR
ncbi:MAG: hypothetical protein HOQ24_01275 [Mycobacteriaceae bacterium]|nr:hypothetical protein [Mycobacteriaceae bacterium]